MPVKESFCFDSYVFLVLLISRLKTVRKIVLIWNYSHVIFLMLTSVCIYFIYFLMFTSAVSTGNNHILFDTFLLSKLNLWREALLSSIFRWVLHSSDHSNISVMSLVNSPLHSLSCRWWDLSPMFSATLSPEKWHFHGWWSWGSVSSYNPLIRQTFLELVFTGLYCFVISNW